ncbi:MAG: cupin domain-containing protein [Phycisphaerae bacterium]|nr:cupin domain-containing protein [Phycisphaerae bacterium]
MDIQQRHYVARFASMDWESPAPKVRRKLHCVGDRQLRVVEFEQGLEHPEWCQVGHVGYVLEGRLGLEFEDETVELGPGDGFVVPDGRASQHRPVPRTSHVLLVLSEQLPG